MMMPSTSSVKSKITSCHASRSYTGFRAAIDAVLGHVHAPHSNSQCSCPRDSPAQTSSPETGRLQQRHRRGTVARAQPVQSASIGLFPAGKQQARVDLPALMLSVEATNVLSSLEQLEAISSAVSQGVNSIILWEGTAGAASLYEAALKLKDVLRGRANVLLVDRTDIAMAAGSEGVLLTDQGVPIIVARRMLTGGASLIGRITSTPEAAVAAAADGANLVLLTGPSGGVPSAAALEQAKQQRSGNPIPVLLALTGAVPQPSHVADALAAGVDGVACTLQQLQAVSQGCGGPPAASATLPACTRAILARLRGEAQPDTLPMPTASPAASSSIAHLPQPASETHSHTSASHAPEEDAPAQTPPGGRSEPFAAASASAAAAGSLAQADERPTGPAVFEAQASTSTGASSIMAVPSPPSSSAIRRLRDPSREAVVIEEKAVLTDSLAFLEQVLPGMSELGLLRDALKALDDLFLVVVVGEFNSGKSSLINALLGDRFLAEGILPTTNEISILKYSKDNKEHARLEQQADGLFVRYLPARLLEGMNVVDTPGTNVILERQQRLTEEYVPRADLVLFIISADRPFSGSEVSFLEYIRQWRKKVVFVINKADMLSKSEVHEVQSFVASNAQRVLGLDQPTVLAVSSRKALSAKLAAAAHTAAADSLSSGILDSQEELVLGDMQEWRDSNFSTFENFICDFLIGRGPNAVEGVRLKLQTPLSVADALLGAAERQLAANLSAAQSELAGVRTVVSQLSRFQTDMDKDARAQREVVAKVVREVVRRGGAFVDRSIKMSNAPILVAIAQGKDVYPFRSAFESEVVGSSFTTLQAAVTEHTSWLQANCAAQVSYYSVFADARAAVLQSSGGAAAQAAASNGALQGSITTALQQLAAATIPASTLASTSRPALPPATAVASPHSPAPATSSPPTPAPSQGKDSEGGAGRSASPEGAGAAGGLEAVYVGAGANALPADVLADFNLKALSSLLDKELQQAMANTAGTAVGAPALGVFATQFIGNTLEDLLLLGIAGLASYVALLNLPLRRSEVKAKIAQVAERFSDDLMQRMLAEEQQEVAAVMVQVGVLLAPLEAAYASEVGSLQAQQAQLAALRQRMDVVGRRIADLE